MELAAKPEHELTRAAVAACLRAVDVRLLDAVARGGVGLDTSAERLVYVAILALEPRVLLLLRHLRQSTDSVLGELARHATGWALGYVIARTFGGHVQALLAAPANDIVLERLARFVREGRGSDA